MDFFLLLALGATGAYVLNHQQQRRRIALLARHLHPYQIERLMEQLTQGYLRAMGEQGDERRQQVLSLLAESETQLVEQFERFVDDFRRVPTALARVSRLPLGLPLPPSCCPPPRSTCASCWPSTPPAWAAPCATRAIWQRASAPSR